MQFMFCFLHNDLHLVPQFVVAVINYNSSTFPDFLMYQVYANNTDKYGFLRMTYSGECRVCGLGNISPVRITVSSIRLLPSG